MAAAKDNFWRKFINSIPIDLPEDGEIYLDEPVEESKPDKSLIEDKNAELLKFTFSVYLISMNEEPYKHFMITSEQVLEDLGEMTIKEALRKIKARKQRYDNS